jgi:hypothetical protein
MWLLATPRRLINVGSGRRQERILGNDEGGGGIKRCPRRRVPVPSRAIFFSNALLKPACRIVPGPYAVRTWYNPTRWFCTVRRTYVIRTYVPRTSHFSVDMLKSD